MTFVGKIWLYVSTHTHVYSLLKDSPPVKYLVQWLVEVNRIFPAQIRLKFASPSRTPMFAKMKMIRIQGLLIVSSYFSEN